MQISDLIQRLNDSKSYKDHTASRPKLYLVHIFLSRSSKDSHLEAGFYDPNDGSITTFKLGDTIEFTSTEMPLRQEGTTSLIKELDISIINYTFDEAIGAAIKVQKENYSKEGILKEILVLQDLGSGPIFNLTFITSTFKTLNVKINAKTLDIISHDLVSLVQFG